MIPTIGAAFTNNTGQTISSLDIHYTGEQWRFGQASRGPDRLDFEYNLTATSLVTASGWVDVNSLDFSTPNTTAAVGALVGNLPANQTLVTGAINGLAIVPGQTFWVRWADFNVTGSDDGLAVDDFFLTPHAAHTASVSDATVTEGDSGTTTASFTVSLTNPAGPGGVTFDVATSDDSAQAPDDYTARSLTGQTIPEGGSTYTFDVAVNGDTTVEPDESFSVDISNVSGADPGDTHAVGTILNDDLPPPVAIHDIQGAHAHLALRRPASSAACPGVVTARSTQRLLDAGPEPDADSATSEGIFVFTGSAPTVAVGDAVTRQRHRAGVPARRRDDREPDDDRARARRRVTVLVHREPAAGADGDRRPAAGSRRPGDRGRRDRQRRDQRRVRPATRTASTSTRASRACASSSTTPSPSGRPQRLRRDACRSATTARNASVRTHARRHPPPRERLQPGADHRSTTSSAPLPTVNVGDHYSGADRRRRRLQLRQPFIEVTTAGLTAIHDGAAARGDRSGRRRRARGRDLQLREPRPDRPAVEVRRRSRHADRQQPALARPVAGEEVQDNNGATDNGVVDATQTLTRLADRRDRGRRRADLRVARRSTR